MVQEETKVDEYLQSFCHLCHEIEIEKSKVSQINSEVKRQLKAWLAEQESLNPIDLAWKEKEQKEQVRIEKSLHLRAAQSAQTNLEKAHPKCSSCTLLFGRLHLAYNLGDGECQFCHKDQERKKRLARKNVGRNK
ncbi:MAG: hypothetical protein KKD44_25940 [Proteobacteria bacterium]|nr:hypothetical protein [Pseudomonadota bacterium]